MLLEIEQRSRGRGEESAWQKKLYSLLSQSAGDEKGNFGESEVWLDFVIANEKQILKIWTDS